MAKEKKEDKKVEGYYKNADYGHVTYDRKRGREITPVGRCVWPHLVEPNVFTGLKQIESEEDKKKTN